LYPGNDIPISGAARQVATARFGTNPTSSVMRHVRFHGILGDDMGMLVRKGDTFFYSLGATIVSSQAGELINEMAVVMSAGLGMNALAKVAHTYPAKSGAIMLAAPACQREFDKAAHHAASRGTANGT